jgi:hypothetical protein
MTVAIRGDNTNGHGAVEVAHPQSAQVPVQFVQQVSGFTQWIDDARQLAPIAESLSKTSFVPKAFSGKPAEITAAILAGQEVGMSPMAALRAIDVIEGKPGMSAIALRALVQGHGHDIWVEESTATRAVVKGRRKGSDRVEKSMWDIPRASKLGLTNKANWKNQPTNMLVARATAECARLVAADVILGMPYSTEELLDGADVEQAPDGVADGGTGEPAKRTAKRKPVERAVGAEPAPEQPRPAAAPLAVSEPAPVVVEPEPEVAPVVEMTMVSDGQRKQMFALWRDLGYDGDDNRAQRLTITGKILGLAEPPESTNDLTVAEADAVIAALKDRRQAQQAQGGESS